jgi:hypothetical protein
MRPAMVALRPGKRRDVVRTSVGTKRSPEMSRSEDVKWFGQRQLTRLTVGWTVGLWLGSEMQPGGPDEGGEFWRHIGGGNARVQHLKAPKNSNGPVQGAPGDGRPFQWVVRFRLVGPGAFYLIPAATGDITLTLMVDAAGVLPRRNRRLPF